MYIPSPNSDPCIHNVSGELSLWSGLKWGKFLFHVMHWADIMVTLRLEYEEDYEYEFKNTEHAHVENFRPASLKRMLGTVNSYS